MMKRTALAGMALFALGACQQVDGDEEAYAADGEAQASATESDIELGNGTANVITTEGIARSGSVFTVPEVTIAQNGWLIMHPFRDGEPVGHEYVGSTLLKAGTTQNVTIDVGEAPETGQMFIIMFHNDVNDDGVFDFGDGDKNVPDEPVFEDGVLIAHPIAAPEDSGT